MARPLVDKNEDRLPDVPRWLCLSHHKCGSTWTVEVLNALCQRSGLTLRRTTLPDILPYDFHRIVPFRERCQAATQEFIAPGADVAFHGNAYRGLVEALDSVGAAYRGFHVIRDPRDIVVSGYFSHLATHPMDPNDNPWMICLRAALQAAPSREAGLLLELDFVSSYFDRLTQFFDLGGPIRTIRFEDLISEPLAVFTDILDWMGLLASPQQPAPFRREDLSDALATLNFARLRESDPGHYRQGKAGDWRNHFTPAVSEAFKQRYPGLLVTLGYEHDDNW